MATVCPRADLTAIQPILYEQVMRVVTTLLRDYAHDVRVGPSPPFGPCPYTDSTENYDVRVTWFDGSRHYGLLKTLSALECTSAYSPRDVVEEWVLHELGAPIGVWRAQQDGVI